MVARARKLMLVEWIDAHAGSAWRRLDEIEGAACPVYCRSVGWLVAREKETTVLVSHISGERNGNLRLFGTGDMAIPNKAIIKMTVLRGG